MAANYEGVSVRKLHSGSEDGYLWYVVNGLGEKVDGAGHLHRESAEIEACEMNGEPLTAELLAFIAEVS